MVQTAQLFNDLLREKGMVVNNVQQEQFNQYYHELLIWNEKMNLTGITEREQVYIKHFYDSVSLSFYVSLKDMTSIADIGSGAGFPSIPLKIMFPHLKILIVDSLNKRVQFLNHLVAELKLSNVECVHGRAEDLARSAKYRDHYDIVTARAVARLNVLNEFCLPFVKPSGLFVAMKGTDPSEELSEAEKSMKELKAKLVQVHNFDLPVEQSHRHLIILQKFGITPNKYPRKSGIPLKDPIV